MDLLVILAHFMGFHAEHYFIFVAMGKLSLQYENTRHTITSKMVVSLT